MKEKIEMLEKSLAANAEEFRKGIRDGEFALKRIEKEIYDKMDEQKKELLKAATAVKSQGNDDNKISGAQQMQNDMFRDQISYIERDLHRLQRIDIKLNRELVQKPYNYINEVRDALDKEQKAIVNIVKTNNDKYVTKIGQMDHKVNKVLVDTETLLDQYRKKIVDIGKNLEKTKNYREEVQVKVDGF